MNALLFAALLVTDAGVAEPERLPAACVGRNLDVDRLFASGRCDVADFPRPSPDASALGIELSPKKLVVRSGKTGRVRITLRNLTAAPLPLDLSEACGATFEPMLFSSNDTRADFPDTCLVGDGGSCNVIVARVVLAPRGVARLHVPVSATKAVGGETCHPTTLMPIEAGTYKLIVNTPFGRRVPDSSDKETRQVTGELTVVDR